MRQLFILFPLFLLLLTACGGEEETKISLPSEAPVENTNEVKLTQKQFDLGLMKLGKMETSTFKKEIKATGTLDVPPENKASVSVYFGGYVKKIKLLPGEKVKKGQTLFVLENPEYIQLQQDFLEIKSKLNYLKQDNERQSSLASENISSKKTAAKAEAEYKMALVQYEGLKKKLGLMGINTTALNEGNLRSMINVVSPISGYITAVNASSGMFLNPSDVAVTITNESVIHVELTLFEQDIDAIRVGQEVSFHLQNSSEEYKAVVHLINKAVDPIKRTVNVHCDLKNEKLSPRFTPGMYVEAALTSSTKKALSLPRSAVVQQDGTNYVLVLKKQNNQGYVLEKKKISVGTSNEYYIEVDNFKDWNSEQQFLINGAFNLIQD